MNDEKGELLYLDSSALVKLVLPEAESAALLVGDDLGALSAYDNGLATAAAASGLEILAPSVTSPES